MCLSVCLSVYLPDWVVIVHIPELCNKWVPELRNKWVRSLCRFCLCAAKSYLPRCCEQGTTGALTYLVTMEMVPSTTFHIMEGNFS